LHPFCIFAAAVAAQQAPSGGAEPAIGAADPAIVVTAAREPIHRDEAAVSLTLFDRPQLEGLALPQAADLSARTGVSVSVRPRGSQTELRIRGAEANHTLRSRRHQVQRSAAQCTPFELPPATSPRIEWCGGRNPPLGSERLAACGGGDARSLRERGFERLANKQP
jgi:hypothetical protein